MPLTKTQSEIWEAMSVGPQWILRSEADPLAEGKESAVPVDSPLKNPSVASPKPVNALKNDATFKPVNFVKAANLVTKPAVSPAEALPVVTPDAALAAQAKEADWEKLKELVSLCKACPMAGSRLHTVFSDGAPTAPIVLVGEAPGRDEDIQGVPFVGKSGQLLTKIIESVGFKRGKDIAIVNVLKCRPPQNRDPAAEEVAACEAFLMRQLTLLKPRVLILAGRIAAMALLKTDKSLSRLRGTVHTVFIDGKAIPAVVTYHPSYLLRSPLQKEECWHDFVTVKRLSKEPTV